MKTIITLLLPVFCLNCFAQKSNTPVRILKISIYTPDGNLWPVNGVQMDTVKVGTKLDSHYFFDRSHSNISLPESFVNTKYKSEKVDIPYGKQDKNKFHFSTYFTYDSLSRVVNYGKTQCTVCDFMGYEYNVHYNSAGLVDELTGAAHTLSQRKRCKLYYDGNGNIKQLDYYEADKLLTQVILL